MKLFELNQYQIIIIGSGLAGITTAMSIAEKNSQCQILVLDKKDHRTSSSYLAKGGLAAEVKTSSINIQKHIEDTMIAGAYENDSSVVEWFCDNASKSLKILKNWGVQFDDDLHIEGGHSQRRIFHITDATGKYIMQRLWEKAKEFPNITRIHNVAIKDITVEKGQYTSITLLYNKKEVRLFSKYLVLAGGGITGLYKTSSNNYASDGEIIGWAKSVGARLSNMAYIQFHPTVFFDDSAQKNDALLITEALRGEGAVLKNHHLKPFMHKYHEKGDLAPRDVVSRSIMKEIENSNHPCVWLDGTQLSVEKWKKHFESLYQELKNRKINPCKEMIPVKPAAHYLCGGIQTDLNGATDVKRVFAVGECANTGLHGANRLASNSLTEAVLLASQCAKYILSDRELMSTTIQSAMILPSNKTLNKTVVGELSIIMEKYAGIIKSDDGLKTGLEKIKLLKNKSKNVVDDRVIIAAESVFEDALSKETNKGVFFNKDLAHNLC